ncbi:S26 family signal peptidase [Nonomuraea sp. NPDC050643]|uniref:S26 family signal peptidase n=1 Tax=Nonomuraea sp. NPDC050643 TaxID=3155660 RepID=UPI0033FF821F
MTAAVLGAVLAVLAVRAALVVVTVRGGSMEPALRDGDRVIVARWARRRVRREAVVVCRAPDGLVLPGRRPTVAADGVLLVKRVAALAGDPQPGGGVVPAGHIYVLGDAGPGLDSGEFGPIPVAAVVGPVIARLGGSHSS